MRPSSKSSLAHAAGHPISVSPEMGERGDLVVAGSAKLAYSLRSQALPLRLLLLSKQKLCFCLVCRFSLESLPENGRLSHRITIGKTCYTTRLIQPASNSLSPLTLVVDYSLGARSILAGW